MYVDVYVCTKVISLKDVSEGGIGHCCNSLYLIVYFEFSADFGLL